MFPYWKGSILNFTSHEEFMLRRRKSGNKNL